MTPVWAVNRALGDKIEKSWVGMAVASVVLGLIGNLLTAPIGKAASAAAGWAMSRLSHAEPEPPHGTNTLDGAAARIRTPPRGYDAAAGARHAQWPTEP